MKQNWLTIEKEDDHLVVNIHGHFSAPLTSDSPRCAGQAITELFDGMATEAKREAERILCDLGLATRQG